MLRALLTDQFRIQTHFEHREQPVYELVIARGGPKLKPSDAAQFSYRATPSALARNDPGLLAKPDPATRRWRG